MQWENVEWKFQAVNHSLILLYIHPVITCFSASSVALTRIFVPETVVLVHRGAWGPRLLQKFSSMLKC